MNFTKQQRLDIYNKYDGKCAYCGHDIEQLKDMQIDHIIPKRNFNDYMNNGEEYKKMKIPYFLLHLTKDDLNHFDNLNPSCRVCNKKKDAYSLENFRQLLEDQINQLNKYSSQYRIAKRYGFVEEKPHKIKFYFEKYLDYET